MTAYPGLNYALYSGQLQNAVWQAANVVAVDVTAQETGPNLYVNRVIATNAGAGQQGLYQFGIPQYNWNYQYSATLWFKPESWSEPIVLTLADNVGAGVTAIFNPYDPTASPTVSLYAGGGAASWLYPSVAVETLSGGWFAITVAGTTSTTPNLFLTVGISSPTPAPVGQTFLTAGVTLYLGYNTEYLDTTTSGAENSLPVFNFPFHS